MKELQTTLWEGRTDDASFASSLVTVRLRYDRNLALPNIRAFRDTHDLFPVKIHIVFKHRSCRCSARPWLCRLKKKVVYIVVLDMTNATI